MRSSKDHPHKGSKAEPGFKHGVSLCYLPSLPKRAAEICDSGRVYRESAAYLRASKQPGGEARCSFTGGAAHRATVTEQMPFQDFRQRENKPSNTR